MTPALCSLLLRPKRQAERKGFLGWFNRTFKKSVDDYLKTSNVIIRHSARTLVLIGIVVAVVLLFVKTVPTGFLPDEDQGYLMADIQLPNAASLGRTQEVIDQLQEVLSKNDNIQSVTAAAGFSLLSGTEAPNSGLVFIRLKDYKQRKMTADEISDMLNGELYEAINSAEVFTFGPPSIPGLGPGSGFTIMIQDKGGNTPQYLAQYTDKFIGEARKRPEIASISTLYQADIPQKAIRINNEKVLKAGVSLQDLHEKISAYLGGSYVNNFNRFGRMYQTYIQAASEYRLTQSDLDLFYITNNRGESLPIASFITVKDTTGPQYTNRFNLYRAASVTGQPAKGYSTGETMQALEEVAARVLPSDMGYAWSNMSYQDAHTTGEATVFLYAIIFIFLILAALYESWSLPLSIILGIPFAVFGAMLFIFLGHLLNPKYINDIFLQVSLIMLIGLAAKNAILIVEYAKAKFDEGLSLRDAAIEGARLRVRPVIMTAFAFLMGVIPLIFATGSNAVARNVMGLGLFGGMLIATLIGIFAYPALFVWIGKMGKYEQKRTAKQQEMTNSEHHE
ncbi:MAG: efflux RND transporter permease subunit [Alistipes indistinctus]